MPCAHSRRRLSILGLRGMDFLEAFIAFVMLVVSQ